MIEPYYEHNGIIIYNCDCREILPNLPKADLCVTDPPYNAGKDYGAYKDNLSDVDYEKTMREIVGLSMSVADNQFWVAPRYKLHLWFSLLPGSHLIVIRRGAAGPYRGGWSDQFEIALAIGKPCRAEKDLWENIRLKGEGYFFKEESYDHPGYTPIKIMSNAVHLLSVDSIIDPFCGTGTSLVVAKQAGRRAVGVELSEKWCEVAAIRLSQEVLPL